MWKGKQPSYKQDLKDILILSFASNGRALLYAGSVEDIFNNWHKAASYAKENGMVPIDITEGGQYLSVPNRRTDLKYTRKQIRRIWYRASVKYCLNIENSVKTFVCGANGESIFRRREILAMLR